MASPPDSATQSHLPTPVATQSATQDSPLLDLPAELRNEIFTFVVVEAENMHISSATFKHPALLDTCKQIRDEAMPMFFGLNIFHFDFATDALDDLYRSLDKIGQEQVKSIGTLVISLDIHYKLFDPEPNETVDEAEDRMLDSVFDQEDTMRAPQSLVNKGVRPESVKILQNDFYRRGEGACESMSIGCAFHVWWLLWTKPAEEAGKEGMKWLKTFPWESDIENDDEDEEDEDEDDEQDQ